MTDQTFTSVMHILDILYKLWPIACGLVVVGIVYLRTRSFFFLFHQILKWLGLEGKYASAADQKVADEYLDLNKFNLKTGFRLKSVKAKNQLHTWLDAQNLEFAELRHAGWYFKANTLNFEIPSKVQILVSRTILILLGLMLVGTGTFLQNPNKALLTVTATRTWFWVGDNEATSVRFDFPSMLRGDPWKIQQHDCRYLSDAEPLDNSWDKDVMCRLVLGFNDGYIAEAIQTQKTSGSAVTVLGLVCLAGLAIFTFWLHSAVQLHRRIIGDAPSDNGNSLPNGQDSTNNNVDYPDASIARTTSAE